MQQAKSNEIEYGSLRQRKMNDVLCELAFIERTTEQMRRYVLKGLENCQLDLKPMVKPYAELQELQESIYNIFKYLGESD